MSTASTHKVAQEPLLNPETFAPYFDKVEARQAELSAALKEGQVRTQRIGAELMDAFLAGQRDTLELTKQITLKPQDYAANIKAIVDASTVAQERAISLAKLFYREQADVAGEMRKRFQSACEATGNLTDAGRNIMNFWTKQR
jgi:hypothetical protein